MQEKIHFMIFANLPGLGEPNLSIFSYPSVVIQKYFILKHLNLLLSNPSDI